MINKKLKNLYNFFVKKNLSKEAWLILDIIKKYSSNIPQVTDNTIIYCDMDGVLVNFSQKALDDVQSLIETGIQGTSFEKNPDIQKAYKSILGTLDRTLEDSDLENPNVRKITFKIISQNPGEWFESLEPLEDGTKKLWKFINGLGYEVKILSAGVSGRKGMPTAEEGKRSWAMKHLEPKPQEVIVADKSSDKKHWATNKDGSPNILIDDKTSNIEQWNQMGGIGILHITGNSDITIAEINKILNEKNEH